MYREAMWRATIRGLAMTSCPSRDELAGVMAGNAGSKNGQEIRAHLVGCPECRRVFESLSPSFVPAPGDGNLGDAAAVAQTIADWPVMAAAIELEETLEGDSKQSVVGEPFNSFPRLSARAASATDPEQT